jgi:hypothetical protein
VRRRFDLETAIDKDQTFANPEQAKMRPAQCDVRALVPLESAAIVLHDQPHFAIRGLQNDADLIRARVLHHVGDGFLQHAKQSGLNRGRQASVTQGDLQVDAQPRALGPFLEILRSRVPQAKIVQRHGPQLPRHAAEVAAKFGRQILEFRDTPPRGRIGRADRCDGVEP